MVKIKPLGLTLNPGPQFSSLSCQQHYLPSYLSPNIETFLDFTFLYHHPSYPHFNYLLMCDKAPQNNFLFSVFCRLSGLTWEKYSWGLLQDYSQVAAGTRVSWRLDNTEYPRCFLHIYAQHLGAVWSLLLSPSLSFTHLILWFCYPPGATSHSSLAFSWNCGPTL